MSRPHADFVSARLRLWQRRVKETAGLVVLPEVGTAQAGLVPVLDQLVAVHNLTSGLVSDLRQTAESSLAGTDVGRQYLSRLAAALAHSSRAASHLSTAVTGLADAHRLTSHPRGGEPVESRLNATLGHSAALRSLNRALHAVTTPDDPLAGAVPLSVLAAEHGRAPDTGGPHLTRRRP
ncbi:hypothetical protein HCK00_23095 [Streptomyces sp. PLAI1-29]|uniref:Uncharacterized protein n=1 Tax=Streptomyces zingiberis TaxID=2053010 RepID=A0ABX1C3V0_9ACTN|nr:hypothetical protein [Streptomyces zingiberis]